MFISLDKNRMINLDHVDRISIVWDDQIKKGRVKFIKCLGAIDIYNSIVGAINFDTKEEMEKFVDKRLKPLTYHPLGNIEFYLEEISKNVGM